MGESYLSQVKGSSSERLEALRSELTVAREIIGEDGTVFATGSFGRLEAGPDSDLDVFVVSRNKDGGEEAVLSLIRQIRLKSELIVAAQKVRMAEFDSGGKFLETHFFDELVSEVGSPADDYKNTFTGRMLLILESRPLLGDEVYGDLKKQAINSYFADFVGNETEFVPYFLINDLLRMWRTFCVNYEHFSKKKPTSDWRIKNLKLKYIRMLTCFSAVIYLSAIYRMSGTVTPPDVEAMSLLSPVERLQEFSSDGKFSSLGETDAIAEKANEAVADYGEFLEFVQEKKEAIKTLKRDDEDWRGKSHEFGGKIAELIRLVNGGDGFNNRLFRSILV